VLFDRVRDLTVSVHRDADAIVDVEPGFLAHQLDLVDEMARQRLPLEIGRHRGVERDDHVSVGRRREARSALHPEAEVRPPEPDLDVAQREGDMPDAQHRVADDPGRARRQGRSGSERATVNDSWVSSA